MSVMCRSSSTALLSAVWNARVDAPIAAAPTKARRLGLVLSWPWITSAFLIDVAVLILANHLPIPAPPTVAWWVGVAVAAMVTIAFLLTYRGITVGSTLARWAWDWSAEMWDSSPDSVATLSPGCTPAVDHRRRFGRDMVGVRDYQGWLVAVPTP
jgi:type VII secretion protein EccE